MIYVLVNYLEFKDCLVAVKTYLDSKCVEKALVKSFGIVRKKEVDELTIELLSRIGEELALAEDELCKCNSDDFKCSKPVVVNAVLNAIESFCYSQCVKHSKEIKILDEDAEIENRIKNIVKSILNLIGADVDECRDKKGYRICIHELYKCIIESNLSTT